VSGKTWAPANYDRTFRGPVTAEMALEKSLNVPTVRASRVIGLDPILETARRAGIETLLKPFPSLVLGAQEVTPLEIASAYATIANGGTQFRPTLVESVEGPDGAALFSRRPGATPGALPARASYLVTAALEGVMDRGTGSTARDLGFTGNAAGKTGTTDDYRDAWFAGYTPDILALVWVGFDDGSSTGLPGARAALPIWVDFMKHAGAQTDETFEEPAGIVWERVDPTSGGRARWSCPSAYWMAFLEGTEPTKRCDAHGWFRRHHKRRAASIE
ncbi:MAG: penicillin-binding transpeptidase domain-containing protein, partial [Acidobacteriota bacterium]